VFNSKKLLLNISFSEKNNQGSNLMMEEINDVDEFMAKFGPDFVFKWGVTFDESLGDKVKVTVLATGFGVENITTTPERTARKSIEDIENAAREAQKRLDRTKRIDTYYGTDLPGGRTKRHTNIYLFRPDDLDNEDIIFAVDESPTYARSQQKLEEIRGYSSAAQKREQNEVEPPTTMQGTISFA
jgi:cell division protein ftsZ